MQIKVGFDNNCEMGSHHFRFPVLILLTFCTLFSFAQVPKEAWTIGPEISSNGIGLSFVSNLEPVNQRTDYWSISMSTLKHDKELKVQNPNFINPKPYIYGKQNAAAVVRANLGSSISLAGRGEQNVSHLIGFEVGPSIAIIKPYYVYTQELDNQRFNPTLDIQDPSNKATQENVLSAAGWTEGLSELTANLGIHLDVNLKSEWNQTYRKQRTKTGIRLDYFFNDIGILYGQENQLFLSYYLSYQIGGNGL